MFFSYESLSFRYEPYPIGLARPLMDPSDYKEFVERFPSLELMKSHAEAGRQGEKFTLSQKLDARGYRHFVRSDPVWREFHKWIKSDAFVFGMLETLAEHDIDLGFRRMSPTTRFAQRLLGRARGKMPSELSRLKARFEFSALPAVGGHLKPHTDSPGKIVTLVVAILSEDGWDPESGGATDINSAKSDANRFNRVNHKADFDEMNVVGSFAYEPNQAVVFVKAHNSWHSVRPMTGKDPSQMRRTLTINIETVD